MARLRIERLDITAQVAERRLVRSLPRPRLPDLVEEPRIADRPPPDHQPRRPRRRHRLPRQPDGEDIPIRKDRRGDPANSLRDPIIMDRRPVHLPHRPPVDRQRIDGMAAKDVEQRVELPRCIEADPGLHRERPRHRRPERRHDLLHLRHVPQQPPARPLSADDRRRTTEVQVDPQHRLPLQRPCRPDQRRDVLPDHLRDHRLPARALPDRADNPLLRLRIAVDAEILRVVEVRPPVAGHHPPERQVGHILHRGQDQQGTRSRLLQEVSDLGVRHHLSTMPGASGRVKRDR